ncbi:hypothetical protein CSUB01_06135 [Colletotrichum sublineola]|uniref:Uncharacterized protein n=1 Tax=Colletotrichum sublineola TaxID=1173701 RepID=A0A066XAF8_COLSU|nr:hypothetical protein CSUB01_06135 [Colletotrichum sublineola]
MVLLEMTTYLTLLILDFFCSLFDAGHHSVQTFAHIILAVFAWLTVGMVIRLFITPVLSWMGYGPKGSIVGKLARGIAERLLGRGDSRKEQDRRQKKCRRACFGGGLGFLGPASWVLYSDFVPAAEFVAHLQRMATAWYTDW